MKKQQQVKIDSISVIILTIAAGLSVDYVVHPSHAFIIRPGTPAHRTEMALKEIGTAVFNGGFSTWLAVVVMAASQTYVFQVFFKILFLVTTLGLAHALLFLPVALCLLAPKPLGPGIAPFISGNGPSSTISHAGSSLRPAAGETPDPCGRASTRKPRASSKRSSDCFSRMWAQSSAAAM